MSYTFFIPVFMVALLGAGCAGGQAPGVSGPPSDGGAVTQSVVIAPTPAPASDQAPVNKPTDMVPTPVPTPNPKPTPTPAPAPTPNPVPAPEPAPSIPMSATIQMNEQGFQPSSVTIAKGGKVIFKNTGSSDVWPASDPHPVHTNYSAFDSRGGIKSGESYEISFPDAKIYTFHDHLHPGSRGSVEVK